jgi:hypothetical protein
MGASNDVAVDREVVGDRLLCAPETVARAFHRCLRLDSNVEWALFRSRPAAVETALEMTRLSVRNRRGAAETDQPLTAKKPTN